MATPIKPDRMLKILKAAGLQIQEYKSWKTHDRAGHGAWGPVHGVMIHHTVSKLDDSSVHLCYNGHATLPGPLCHAVGRNDGVVALVSGGRANHAGSGDDDVLKAVINETALPSANEANTDGNARFYGIELVNLGDGKDTYTAKQYRSAILWAAAICREHGWSARSVIGHKEWQPGKIDPKGPIEGKSQPFSMSTFRAQVDAQLKLWANPPEPEPTPEPKPPTVPSKPDPAPGSETGAPVRYTQLSRQENLTIGALAEKDVYFTYADIRDDPNEHGPGGYTVLSSPAVYTGTVSVWAPEGESLSLVVVQELADATLSTSSTADIAALSSDPTAVSVTGYLPAGRKLRVKIRNYGAAPVTVSRVDLRLVSWAE